MPTDPTFRTRREWDAARDALIAVVSQPRVYVYDGWARLLEYFEELYPCPPEPAPIDKDGRANTDDLSVLGVQPVALGEVFGWLSRELPKGWELRSGGQPADDGARWYHRGLGLAVIESFALEADGRRWHHVSVSRRSRCPTWDEMCLAHRLFIGDEVAAYQVHVPRSRWISIHPFCLHLWACLDAPAGVLPDFARGGQTI